MTAAGTFIGMDEAGYGPNLGPLLLAATCWNTPEPPDRFDFQSALSPAVSATGPDGGRCLHIADSKKVNVGKQGFASLERSALSLIQVAGGPVHSFHELWNWLAGMRSVPAAPLAPWYEADRVLPVSSSGQQIDELSGALQFRMEQTGLSLTAVRGEIVVEQRFNRAALADGSNKALALSRFAFGLLKQVWNPASSVPTLIVADKHGGRNRYDELLSEILDGEYIGRLEEGQLISRYRVGASELRFQVNGEQHFPVACASVIAKYVRELAMQQFNDFWRGRCPGVKPTLGYPVDAKRFRAAILPEWTALQLEDEILWRER